MADLKAVAARALACLDLTNLNDDCTEADIEALCARAQTGHGNTAAVCVWPRFVNVADSARSGTDIKVATVVNFPSGDEALDDVLAMTQQALAEFADEIDLVIPYRALMDGDAARVSDTVAAVKAACGEAVLKTILETGELKSEDLIRKASQLAIGAGADFIKTSTGKVSVNATPEAARVMLEEIKASGKPVGLKPAGGVKTTEDAKVYLDMADEIMGADWAGPQTFRFGASGVLDALLATLDDAEAPAAGTGY